MSNQEVDPGEVVCAAGEAPAGVELLEPREVPLGGPRAMTRAPYPPAAAPLADRGLVLRRPLRPRRRGRLRRHVRRAAPAHRAADGQLAVRRRDRAPRQRRQPRAGAARRGQPDDRRSRHQPLRGLDRRHRRAARRAAVGGAAGRRPRRRAGLPAPRPRPGARPGLGGAGLPRLAARARRRRSSTHTPLLGAEIMLAPGATLESTSTPASSTACWSTPGVGVADSATGGRPRPSPASWPTSRPDATACG